MPHRRQQSSLIARCVAAVAAALFFACSAAAAPVDANRATQAELESIRGIGPGTSSKILNERKKAPFKDWNDLVERVHGVGPGSAAKLSGQGLTVNGASYAGAVSSARHKGDGAGGKPAVGLVPAGPPAKSPAKVTPVMADSGATRKP